MEENKDKLVFSSITSETNNTNKETTATVVNNAFKEEQLRQTAEIPVQEIANAAATAKESIKKENKVLERLSTLEATQTMQLEPVETKPIEEKEEVVEKKEEPIVEEQKPVKVKKHIKKSVKFSIALIIIAIITTFVLVKSYIEISKPSYITKKALLNISNEITEVFKFEDNKELLGNTFNIDTTIKTNLESQKVLNEYATDPNMLEYYYLLYNLNNLNHKVKINHDFNNKKLLYNYKATLNNKEIINDKYLIDNSTEYYFVKDYFNTYINNGNNAYFETITEDKNALYNIDYLYKVITNSISNCIDEEDYIVTKENTPINGKYVSTKKITINLNNNKMIDLANKVLDSLKEDKESFNILNAVIEDFENYQISKNTKYLKSNEEIIINLYTTGLFNNTKKYEVIINKKNMKYLISYETDYKIINYSKNDILQYSIKYKKNNNLNANIYDINNNEIGKLELDTNRERINLVFEYNDKVTDINLNINYKVLNKKKNSYDSTILTNISYKKNNIMYLNGTINVDNTINRKVKIEEDINEVVFEKEITEEKSEELKTLLKKRLKKAIN